MLLGHPGHAYPSGNDSQRPRGPSTRASSDSGWWVGMHSVMHVTKKHGFSRKTRIPEKNMNFQDFFENHDFFMKNKSRPIDPGMFLERPGHAYACPGWPRTISESIWQLLFFKKFPKYRIPPPPTTLEKSRCVSVSEISLPWFPSLVSGILSIFRK